MTTNKFGSPLFSRGGTMSRSISAPSIVALSQSFKNYVHDTALCIRNGLIDARGSSITNMLDPPKDDLQAAVTVNFLRNFCEDCKKEHDDVIERMRAYIRDTTLIRSVNNIIDAQSAVIINTGKPTRANDVVSKIYVDKSITSHMSALRSNLELQIKNALDEANFQYIREGLLNLETRVKKIEDQQQLVLLALDKETP